MLPRRTLLIAVAVGLLSAIVFNSLLRPSPSRRFQIISANRNSDAFLLDTYEGRVWERDFLPLQTSKFGWLEMIRLDTPPSLYGSENKKWARKTARDFENGRENVELKESLNNKLDTLFANEASVKERLEAIRQAAIDSLYEQLKKDAEARTGRVDAHGIRVDADGHLVLMLTREDCEATFKEPPEDNPEVKGLQGRLAKIKTDIADVQQALSEIDTK